MRSHEVTEGQNMKNVKILKIILVKDLNCDKKPVILFKSKGN